MVLSVVLERYWRHTEMESRITFETIDIGFPANGRHLLRL